MYMYDSLSTFVECFVVLVFLSLVLLVFIEPAYAVKKPRNDRVKTLHLTEDMVSNVYVSQRGAVLNFTEKPSNVVLGNKGNFKVEYINNDLVISPLKPGARVHLFVYLRGRRFNMDLISKPTGYTLIQIRDTNETIIQAPHVR